MSDSKDLDRFREIEARLTALENANKIGVGEYNVERLRWWNGYGEVPSPYPHHIPLEEAIRKVMDHCGIKLDYAPPVEGRVEVKQEKTKKKT